MKLLTKEILKKLPALYSTEDISLKEKLVVCKFFTPDSNWTWYAIEYDPIDGLFWGFVEGFEGEFGNFSLQELEEARGPLGLKIERDMWFTPAPIKDITRISKYIREA